MRPKTQCSKCINIRIQIRVGRRPPYLCKSVHPRNVCSAAQVLHLEPVQKLESFNIVYQDEHLVCIEKPSGFHVHQPEDGFPIPQEENAMKILKRQLGGTYLYPVHRLDRPTSGVVVYCTTREAASGFGLANRERRVNKTYIAMCRGHADTTGIVDQPLDGAACSTSYETLGTAEVMLPVGKYPMARLSLLKVMLMLMGSG
ncbi:hypothetical protein CEUSTIGMA_g10247.t1 [Chlamydomonas eustigma]|uniref:Pseudouridine synthase RsuA/RluA-like domain-containing protein n=1 Tax=Chlamydomonas eustigma TaxID=1157962 RepID=A0A250XIB3_9CHLO|nr:hypothetical protein CEUSTIGMA_g10247.t1 [Chlamydomonas eustigma]|eukprot:GAX82821.1 hypothetical protein CEUSTIGMA_g10247.t1 [Chlamydomonas eustigma]